MRQTLSHHPTSLARPAPPPSANGPLFALLTEPDAAADAALDLTQPHLAWPKARSERKRIADAIYQRLGQLTHARLFEEAARLRAVLAQYQDRFPGEWVALRATAAPSTRELRRAAERASLEAACAHLLRDRPPLRDGQLITDTCPRCGAHGRLRACFSGLLLCYPCYFAW